MATYEYQCPEGHITELQLPMADDKPESVVCGWAPQPSEDDGGCDADCEHCDCSAEREPCGKPAARLWEPWAATHYKGAGTYTTDYRLKYDRKSRRRQSMPVPVEAAITRAEGAEHDPPKRVPGGVVQWD